ncbi:MAG: SAM-dependent methyltransferase [Pseudohongiellaceae bacterium]
MNPVDTAKAYNQITHLWESDEFERSNGVEQHERAIAFLKNSGPALDVGCGCSGRFIDLLLSKGFKPEGVDISSEMLRLARKKHPDIKFHQEDICKWELTRTYDFITAWDSIWHVPLDQQELVLTKLISSLNSNGILIFTCGGTDDQGELRDDYMGPEVYYSSLGINAYLHLFSRLNCICRHLEYDQYPEIHTYFIVQKI